MAKKKDDKKSTAAVKPDLEAEVKRLRKENGDLRKRLDKIAALAEDLPGGDDELEEDEDPEDEELLDDEDLEDVDDEEEEDEDEDPVPIRRLM